MLGQSNGVDERVLSPGRPLLEEHRSRRKANHVKQRGEEPREEQAQEVERKPLSEQERSNQHQGDQVHGDRTEARQPYPERQHRHRSRQPPDSLEQTGLQRSEAQIVGYEREEYAQDERGQPEAADLQVVK